MKRSRNRGDYLADILEEIVKVTLVLRNTTLTYCVYTISAKLPQHKKKGIGPRATHLTC